MNEDLSFKEGDFGFIKYKSTNPFEFFHILNELDNLPEQDLEGWLLFPEEGKKPYSCMVCVHHSGGWGAAQYEMIKDILESGIAVFQVNSFESRGVTSTAEEQMAVTTAMILADAFEPLKFLSKHPDIDKDKIGICGWSLGAGSSLYAGWLPLAEKLAPHGERFALHLNYYPLASYWPEEMRWTKAPILNLLGDQDDYTPFELAQELTIGINESGANCKDILYQGGLHGFDSMYPKTFWPDSIAPKVSRFAKIDNNGDMTYETDDGKVLSLNSPDDRLKLFEEVAKFGAWTGGTWALRRACKKDALEFLKKNLF